MSGVGKIRIAVVGAGYWGPNLVRNFNQSRDAEVTLVCDVDEARLSHVRNLYPHVRVSTDHREATQGRDADAVCIATPVRWHYEMAKEALSCGKHVLVEKPMTADVSQARELVELAGKEGRVLLVDHTFEYAPAVNRIKEIIESGELGDIYYVSMSRLNLGLFQKDINVIWDLAPHDISILSYVLGVVPETVAAHGNANIVEGIEDVVMLTLQFANKMIAYLHMSWLDPCKIRRSTFVGSKKMLVYDDVEPLEKIKIYNNGVDGPKHYDTSGEFQFSYRYGDIHIPYLENHEPLTVECRHFLDCIRNGTKPRSGGQDGLNVVRVISAAQESLRGSGASVRVA